MEATPSREGPQSSTRRRYPVAYDPHWVRTPSTILKNGGPRPTAPTMIKKANPF
jgi:hypothetical protein